MRFYKRVLFLLIVLCIVGVYDVITTPKENNIPPDKQIYKEMVVTTKDKRAITIYATEEQLEDLNRKNTIDGETKDPFLYGLSVLVLSLGTCWCLFELVLILPDIIRKEKKQK